MDIIIVSNYAIKCCYDLQMELLENQKIGHNVPWINFNRGDIYTDKNLMNIG